MSFWWRSQVYRLIHGHMGPYYLREILRDLTLQELQDMVDHVGLLPDTATSESSEETSSQEQVSEKETEDCLPSLATNVQAGFPCLEYQSLSQEGSCPTSINSPSSIGTSGLPFELNHLEPCEKEGLSRLMSILCAYSLATDIDCTASNANQIVQWLTTFDSLQVARILCVLSSMFPVLFQGLWDLLPPLGGFLLTNHFDHLEEEFATGCKAPMKEELYCQLYGINMLEV